VRADRPRLAVFKFASCDGCQLTLLNLEDDLLALSERFEWAFFLEATSRRDEGPWDVALVEGSVTTAADTQRIRWIRERTRTLIAIGACATSGGIQALRNTADVEEWKSHVYPHPEWIDTLAHSTPLSEHVGVDAELQGCPIDRGQLLRVLARALLGARPELSGASVCTECKRAGNVCVLVARSMPCMGPITRAGCGAICPAMGRECYACFGPSVDPNAAALMRRFEDLGVPRRDAVRRLRGINGWRREFREIADALEETE
jgi:coenzyme F420-reducing hydrogenase gamma subunit